MSRSMHRRWKWALAAVLSMLAPAGLGWLQAGVALEAPSGSDPASPASEAASMRSLSLPRPPSHAVPAPAGETAKAARSAIPPPGGFPVEVLHEMWEVALRTPRKVGDTPLTAENWFITGVFTRDDEHQVIVQRGSDPKPHFHRVGDALPGGARIVWVKPNVIGLQNPGSEAIALPLNQPLRAAATSAP